MYFSLKRLTQLLLTAVTVCFELALATWCLSLLPSSFLVHRLYICVHSSLLTLRTISRDVDLSLQLKIKLHWSCHIQRLETTTCTQNTWDLTQTLILDANCNFLSHSFLFHKHIATDDDKCCSSNTAQYNTMASPPWQRQYSVFFVAVCSRQNTTIN